MFIGANRCPMVSATILVSDHVCTLHKGSSTIRQRGIGVVSDNSGLIALSSPTLNMPKCVEERCRQPCANCKLCVVRVYFPMRAKNQSGTLSASVRSKQDARSQMSPMSVCETGPWVPSVPLRLGWQAKLLAGGTASSAVLLRTLKGSFDSQKLTISSL